MTTPVSRPAPRSLDQQVDVETPEQVVFSYTSAGVGSRAAAALFDYLVCFGLLAGLALLVAFGLKRAGGKLLTDATTTWVVALFVVGQFAILWGYYVLFEGLRDGQTPGKRRLGLRVVRDGGYSVTFAASAARNLVRIVDMQPVFLYGVGILSVAVSRHGRRLGDMVAGTIVVREQMIAATAPVMAADAPRAAITTILTDDEFALVERFVSRRNTLEAGRRTELATAIAARFRDRAAASDVGSGGQPAALVIRLYERERDARARGVAARSDTGAAREQHAIVALGGRRWAEFATVLAEAQRRGLSALGEEGVSDFVARYRELGTDLARLRTAARGRELDALFYLSRLVAGGHNLLYRQRQLVLRSIWRYLAFEVPREVRRSVMPILLSAAFLFVPAAMAYVVAYRDPATARRFLPAEMVDRAESGAVRERRGEGFLPQQMADVRGPMLASFITVNNVQITFGAFALGITAGLGTVFVLVSNGVQIGGGLGLFASERVLHLILSFVAPHGVLELTAIAIAGGGGLLLASAILLPGAVTRREALVERGRRAMALIAASSVLLVIAGLIEGNISPLPWPIEWKLFVSLLTALFLVFYLTRGRAGTEATTTAGKAAEGAEEQRGRRGKNKTAEKPGTHGIVPTVL